MDSSISDLDPIGWMCPPGDTESGPSCSFRLGPVRKDPASWSPMGTPIKYCLSERVPEQCTVQSSLPIVSVILVLNLAKAIMMFMIAFGVKESPLMTMGDAIASFLHRPDEYTKEMCLASRSDIQMNGSQWSKAAMLYNPRPRRLLDSASKARWRFCLLL